MASSFSLHHTIDENVLIDTNQVDWLRDLQIRFAQEKVSEDLEYPDAGSISNNKKAKNVPMDIIFFLVVS